MNKTILHMTSPDGKFKEISGNFALIAAADLNENGGIDLYGKATGGKNMTQYNICCIILAIMDQLGITLTDLMVYDATIDIEDIEECNE